MPRTFKHRDRMGTIEELMGELGFIPRITLPVRQHRVRCRVRSRPPIERLNGSQIRRIETLSSRFDKGHLLKVYLTTGEICRMSTMELLKLVRGFLFDAQMKRVYKHLTVAGEIVNHQYSDSYYSHDE